MCKFIRRYDGISPITNIANLGLQVSLRDEDNLKLSRFFINHKERIVRVVVPTDITLDIRSLLCKLNENKKEHTDPLVYPVIDAKTWPKTMECLEEYLRGHIGFKGVPLSYVVRYKESVAPSLYEPGTIFLSPEDEMVARAPILEGGLRTVTFKTDMMKV